MNESAYETLKQSLKNFQTDYIDLYLIHFPINFPKKEENNEFRHKPIHKLWPELERCVKEGLVRSIGVSNFNVSLLCDLLSYCEIKPAVNEVEIQPFL